MLAAFADSFLIAPFAWLANPILGMWLGCAILAIYCVIVGDFVGGLLFLANKKHHITMQDEMMKSHNLSVQALQQGDKESYLAINRVAHEQFGKSFFAQAGLGMSSLLPVPFALWWLSLRFEGIPIHYFPFTQHPLGYPFVFLFCYIALRIAFSRIKKHLPFFGYVYTVQQEAKQKRGEMRSFFSHKEAPTPPASSQPE